MAAAAYVREWIADLTDVTDLAHAVHRLVESGDVHGARALLPVEAAYLLPPDAAAAVGAATGGWLVLSLAEDVSQSIAVPRPRVQSG